MQSFRALGALPPNPQFPAAGGFAPRPPLASGGWGLRPQTPQTAPHCEFLATRLGKMSAFLLQTGKLQNKKITSFNLIHLHL